MSLQYTDFDELCDHAGGTCTTPTTPHFGGKVPTISVAMAQDKKETDAVFRIMWEVAKVDRQPIQIGNTVFDPFKIDRERAIDSDRLELAISYLRQKQSFIGADECLHAGQENKAREVLKFHYPWLRTMRDEMWTTLFDFLIPKGEPERIRVILRRYADTFRTLTTDDELRKLAFAALDNANVSVPRNRKTRQSWAKTFSELKKGTPAYKRVMTSLRRYYAGYKK